MNLGNILVVESEPALAQQVLEMLRPLPCQPIVVATLAAAFEVLARHECDVVLAGLTLSDGPVTHLLEHLAVQSDAVPLVVLSGSVLEEGALEPLRRGAAGYVLRPCSAAQLETVLAKALDHARWVKAARWLSHHAEPDDGWELLGESDVMRRLQQSVRQIARTDATVLITGEAGTGKERLARALYRQSLRAQAPLIETDCAAGPETRLAAEWFGQETVGTVGGARYAGCFELADGGTVLLSEIAHLSSDLQGRLLDVLQAQTVRRLDGHQPRQVNVRVLATTSRSLDEAVRRGLWREDLHLRLNIAPLHVPPLRHRQSDLPLLAEFFRQHFARRHGSPALAISPESLAMIQSHSWPGNVRELKAVMEQAVLACTTGHVLQPAHFERALGSGASLAHVASSLPAADVPDDLGEIEKRHILAVVAKYNNNRTRAAQHLGISIRTLRNKLKEYRLRAIATLEPPVASTGTDG
ncbi:MAG: sigma-54-dependent Fis family transcriptional regulator [Verrucomicrobia bacterium]|nr:sigma-54-dependent Fis family transcriptional regulator [Verrucomicrobiota bacterium]